MGKFTSQNFLVWPRTMKNLSPSDPKQLAAWEPIRPYTCRAFFPRVADQEGGGSGGHDAILPLSTMVAWLHGANPRIQSRDIISYQLIHFIYIYTHFLFTSCIITARASWHFR
jgi:hypothetical protein